MRNKFAVALSATLTMATVGVAVVKLAPRHPPQPVLSATDAAPPPGGPAGLNPREVATSLSPPAETGTAAEETPPAAPTPTGTNQSGPEVAAKPTADSATPPPSAPPGRDRAVADPWARVALASVGEDFEATDYWLGAINDPSVPAEERKDLIEDLNEDGFSDPKHPTAAELPLILNRLALLEAVASQAMDQVNADAMAEAYKDLVAMAQGQPHD